MDRLPPLRASDEDREVAAEQLRAHHRAGRLSTEELEERVERTLAATTVQELAELLLDLPAPPPAVVPAPAAPVLARPRPGRLPRVTALAGVAALVLGAGVLAIGDDDRGGFLEPEPSVSTVLSGEGRDGDLAFRVLDTSESAGEVVVNVRVRNLGDTPERPFCPGGAALRTYDGAVVERDEDACALELGPGESAQVDLVFAPEEGTTVRSIDLWDDQEASDPDGLTRLRFGLRTG